jgi:NAD(P)-dependent dehydrogenase (short-subunit alcohol dehydrogenase family)
MLSRSPLDGRRYEPTPRQDVLPHSERLRLLALDVTDPENFRQAAEAAGPDTLVNNAGLRRASPFEAALMATVREVFEINVFGTMAVTRQRYGKNRALYELERGPSANGRHRNTSWLNLLVRGGSSCRPAVAQGCQETIVLSQIALR